MNNTVLVEIPYADLFDKITILQMKMKRIVNAEKLSNVRAELNSLERIRDSTIQCSQELDWLTDKLKTTNEALWDIEDAIRECERRKDFGERFIELARSVYHLNDGRAALKRQINELLGSRLVEEKSYSAYAEDLPDGHTIPK